MVYIITIKIYAKYDIFLLFLIKKKVIMDKDRVYLAFSLL